MKKIKKLNGKLFNIFGKIRDRFGESNDDARVKPLVTSRVLFISILDKLYFIGLILSFIFVTFGFVKSNLDYFDYDSKFFSELWPFIGGFIGIVIVFVGVYFVLNWLYKCAAKTMLCLTNKEIYGEVYVPFYKGELSIPVECVTKVDTINFLWIFRFLIIHRYHQIPIVFATWNAQEFKDKLVDLLFKRDEKIENKYVSKGILPEWLKKKYFIILIFLAVMLGIVIIAYTINYFDNPYKKIPGTYVLNKNKIILKEDKTCDLINLIGYDVTKCNWNYSDEINNIRINIDYSYKYQSNWSNKYYDSDRTLTLNFDADDETLIYNVDVYKKEK